MKGKNIFIFLLLSLCVCAYRVNGEIPKQASTLSFKENKGQVGDQFSKPRPDVLFVGNSGALSFYLRNNGISYQLYHVDSWTEIENESVIKTLHRKKTPARETIYRLDLNWLNANSSANIKKENPTGGYDNYYNEVCPNGVTGVKSYKTITYQNVYNGIDLKWYEKDGNLKYDYVVAPGTDPNIIQMEIKGAEHISLDKNGNLIIKTPLGTLTEKAPLATQNGKQLNAKWKIVKNIVSFEILHVDPSKMLIIDPLVRLWGTYYGGVDDDCFNSLDIDAGGNIYVTGYSDSHSNIATVGAFQFTAGGGPSGPGGQWGSWDDAILIKFNSAGTRLWGTYYGGSGGECGYHCDVNKTGDVIAMCGSTSTSLTGVMATAGSHQANYGGNASGPAGDAYLVTFDSTGMRQWATYYGGSSNEWGYCCAIDGNGDIFLSGQTSSTNSIASAGCHQASFGGYYDTFIAKFTSSGVMQWGTYYGGTAFEGEGRCSPDGLGNVYLVGNSQSNSGIASSGAFQFTYGGGVSYLGDAFIVKFNSSGARSWGTYYGGGGDDLAEDCVIDPNGDLYVSGTTTGGSQTVIPTPNVHQSAFGGGSYDAFILKFSPGGMRLWCTYYGGKRDETDNQIIMDPFGNIYLSGVTTSTNAISTPCAWQTNYAGIYDSYLVKFNSNGERLWGTYYGGPTYDDYCVAATDGLGNVYLAGWTDSGTGISTPGSHQSVFSGGYGDGFLVKFDGCVPDPINTTVPDSLRCCFGKGTQISAGPNCNITWYDAAVGGNLIGDSVVYVTATLSTTTTFYASEGSCGTNTVRAAITVTVDPPPTIIIDIDPKVLCYKASINAKATGAVSYTWYPDQWISCTSCPDPILSPLETMQYCVEGTDSKLCVGKTCTTVEVNFSGDHNFSLPNAFTPNNDGINDVFCLQGWNTCNERFHIMIYDRWGEKVFESSDPGFCWNGIYKGQLLSGDVYVYSVSATYKDNTEVNKKGNITLIR
jgi:gliding motility-associated-like protein